MYAACSLCSEWSVPPQLRTGPETAAPDGQLCLQQGGQGSPALSEGRREGGRWDKMNVEHWKCVYTYLHHLDSPSHLEIHHPCFPLIPLLPPPPRLPRLLPPPPLLLLPLLLPHLSSPQCETWVHTVIWWTVHCSVDQLSDQHDALADPGQESNTMHVCVFVYTYWYGDWLHRGGWKLSVSGTTCTVTIAMPVCYALHFSHKKRLMTPVYLKTYPLQHETAVVCPSFAVLNSWCTCSYYTSWHQLHATTGCLPPITLRLIMTSGDRLSSETSCSCSSTLLHASLAEGKQSNTYPSKQRENTTGWNSEWLWWLWT